MERENTPQRLWQPWEVVGGVAFWEDKGGVALSDTVAGAAWEDKGCVGIVGEADRRVGGGEVVSLCFEGLATEEGVLDWVVASATTEGSATDLVGAARGWGGASMRDAS